MIEDAIISLFQQVYGKYARAKRHPLWTIDRLILTEAHKDKEGCYFNGQRMARYLEVEGYEAVNCLGDTMDISSAKVVRFDHLENGVIWVSWCWGPYVPIKVCKINEKENITNV